jgi:hypothetical protein
MRNLLSVIGLLQSIGKEGVMCWFSAHERLPTRDAIEGEELVVRQFPDLGRRWLASPEEPDVAVCICNGCNLRLSEVPGELQALLGIGPEAVARFQQNYLAPRKLLRRFLPPENLQDVLVFPGGNHFPVGHLPIGMRIDVLSTRIPAPLWEGPESRVKETAEVAYY